MPRIIDYPTVRDTLLARGLISLYHNSGAFGFPQSASPQHVGWIGPPDPTIRPAALALARHVPPPFERNLAELAAVTWQQHLPGVAWVMPKSHWAYELDHGSKEWMPGLLQSIDIDAGQLITRNDGTALEFAPDERPSFVRLLEGLLHHLHGSSDFALAFPGHPTLCTVHHHKQLWWSTISQDVWESLNRLVPSPAT